MTALGRLVQELAAVSVRYGVESLPDGAAAEAEVRRLDILVAELIDALKKHEPFTADALEQRHNDERVRPETVRPVVDRPVAPWEMPVIEMPARRRGRWW
ncbi:hypothetical protein CQY20_31995 [Mycolicibacterium agri]|uniref:Uncharacterized protein n=1 Tax=Mycolicibacterium agri TaxID=36811 RepID=A0A2A7MNU0_MYCAG|nr:hypothetical protein CQY20_31995 [Mycolicibacterium agri]GFG50150.1 hypothetical protein MAGR_15910 [Mycolicibacterium agri]